MFLPWLMASSVLAVTLSPVADAESTPPEDAVPRLKALLASGHKFDITLPDDAGRTFTVKLDAETKVSKENQISLDLKVKATNDKNPNKGYSGKVVLLFDTATKVYGVTFIYINPDDPADREWKQTKGFIFNLAEHQDMSKVTAAFLPKLERPFLFPWRTICMPRDATVEALRTHLAAGKTYDIQLPRENGATFTVKLDKRTKFEKDTDTKFTLQVKATKDTDKGSSYSGSVKLMFNTEYKVYAVVEIQLGPDFPGSDLNSQTGYGRSQSNSDMSQISAAFLPKLAKSFLL